MSFLTGVEIDIDVANIVFVHGGTELRPRPVARARFADLCLLEGC